MAAAAAEAAGFGDSVDGRPSSSSWGRGCLDLEILEKRRKERLQRRFLRGLGGWGVGERVCEGGGEKEGEGIGEALQRKDGEGEMRWRWRRRHR